MAKTPKKNAFPPGKRNVLGSKTRATTKKAVRKAKPLPPGEYKGTISSVIMGHSGDISRLSFGFTPASEPKPPRTLKEALEVIKVRETRITTLMQDIKNLTDAHTKQIAENDLNRAKSESRIHESRSIQLMGILENFSHHKTL